MKRTYEYRLYPRRAEQKALNLLLEQHREVYNRALEQGKNAYEATGKGQTAISQWPYFRDWRNAFSDLLINASSLQHTLRRLDKAFGAFFRRVKAGADGVGEPQVSKTSVRPHRTTPGYPRFKGKDRLKSIEYTYGDGCKLDYDEAFDRFALTVQNVGSIKVKLHRFLPDKSRIKHVVIQRKATGWYAYVMLEMPDIEVEPNGLPCVGGDMGLLRLLSLSDGTLIDNPRWLRGALAELRRSQRRLSRAVKGSHRRKDKRLLVAKLHEHVANIRKDFWHKLTHWLVHTYGLIALEKLTLDFMLRNSHLSLSAHDAGLGAFQTLLCYKAVEAGSHVTFVPAAYTSQACSGCGALVEKDLSVRVHSCPNPECLLELDRDVNAAINILDLALVPSGRLGILMPTTLRPDGQSAWIGPSVANVAAVQGKRRLRSSPIFRGE